MIGTSQLLHLIPGLEMNDDHLKLLNDYINNVLCTLERSKNTIQTLVLYTHIYNQKWQTSYLHEQKQSVYSRILYSGHPSSGTSTSKRILPLFLALVPLWHFSLMEIVTTLGTEINCFHILILMLPENTLMHKSGKYI